MTGGPRLVLAPDSWGGFLGAPVVAERMAGALRDLPVELVLHPLADGGEGTEEVLRWHGERTPGIEVRATAPSVEVATPAGSRRPDALELHSAEGQARIFVSALVLDDGLGGRPEARRPALASSLGLGQWLAHGGVPERPWLVTLGGSATVDGGVGLAMGLGLTVLDEAGRRLPPRGDSLLRAVRVEGPVPQAHGRVTVLADVRTRLVDAQARFGPQKGLADEAIPVWTDALRRWAVVLAAWRQSQGLAATDRDLPGGGAAGGVGLALHALLDAPIRSGASTLLRWTGAEDVLRSAELVVTGEGRLDEASFEGKVVGEVHRCVRDAEDGPALVAFVGQDRRVSLDEPGLEVLACPAGAEPEQAFEEGLRRLRAWAAARLAAARPRS